jgi:hypothetical protein
MSAARAITIELRRRERRAFFVALRHYLLVGASYLLGFVACYAFVVLWLSLDVLFA